jgi:glucose/arabinose dehydrogenase
VKLHRPFVAASALLVALSAATASAQSPSAGPSPALGSPIPFGSSGPTASIAPGASEMTASIRPGQSFLPLSTPAESLVPLATPGAPAQVAALTVTLEPFTKIPQSATYMGSAFDGTGQMYALQQLGRIWLVGSDGTVGDEPWLDLTDEVLPGGERGLLGLAFHPGFPADPRFYFFYTRTSDHADVLGEMSVVNGVPDRTTERTLLVIDDPFPNHNGGMLAFGHDGYLYIGTGDGGDADDPFGNGQNTQQLLGKILRIDVDGVAPYAIPADNPSNRGAAVSPEIWDWGMRNPWRFSFDSPTGWLWIGDVGQDTTEEIDLEAPGTGGFNYGWNVMEGTHCFQPATGCDQTGLTLPLLDYAHTDNRCAVIGGYVDHSTTYPTLDGVYFYGDYCSGEIFALDANTAEVGGKVKPKVVAKNGFTISAFAQDEKGDVYVVGVDGTISLLTGGLAR